MQSLRCVVSYTMLEVVDAIGGHWCPRCALPSAVSITIASITNLNGVDGPMKLSTRLRCDDGHGWL